MEHNENSPDKDKKEELTREKESTDFPFAELPDEIKVMIVELLPDKELLNLRSTSKKNRAMVDEIILRPENLDRLFERFTPDQAISFINTYLTLYQDDFANRVKNSFFYFLSQLSPNEIMDVFTKTDVKNDIFNRMILDHIKRDFSLLLTCSHTHFYEFAHKFPNLFEKEMDQPEAPLFDRLIYIRTVSDVHKLTPAFMNDTLSLLNDYRAQNPRSMNKAFNAFTESMEFQTLLAKFLHHPEYEKGDESRFAYQPFLRNLNPGFVNLQGLNLSNQAWEFYTWNRVMPLNFSEVNMQSNTFSGSNLSKFVFIRANLKGANFTNTDLTGANLSGADLTNANLSHANLTGANLSGANLKNTNFSHANLTGVKFLDLNSFKTKDLLTQKLFQLYDKFEDHPQFFEIVKALAEQIHSYAKTLAEKNPNLAKALVDAALHHGIFMRSDKPVKEKPKGKKPTLQPDIYKQPPPKPEPSQAVKLLEQLDRELKEKYPTPKQGPR